MLMDGRESVVGQSEALAYSRPTPVDTFIRTLYPLTFVNLCDFGGLSTDYRALASALRVRSL